MKILMVCLGNICRSPLAEGILTHKIKTLNLTWEVDSAGTSGWHNGEPPDERSIAKAKEYGIDISHQVSRQINRSDLEYFDLILVMDSSNYQNVKSICDNERQYHKIKLILNYVYPDENRAVPDPYYDNSFEQTYQLLDEAIDQIIKDYS